MGVPCCDCLAKAAILPDRRRHARRVNAGRDGSSRKRPSRRNCDRLLAPPRPKQQAAVAGGDDAVVGQAGQPGFLDRDGAVVLALEAGEQARPARAARCRRPCRPAAAPCQRAKPALQQAGAAAEQQRRASRPAQSRARRRCRAAASPGRPRAAPANPARRAAPPARSGRPGCAPTMCGRRLARRRSISAARPVSGPSATLG